MFKIEKINLFELKMSNKKPKADKCRFCGAYCGDTVCPDCKKKNNIRFD